LVLLYTLSSIALKRDVAMAYAAFGLTILGLSAGLMSRLKVLVLLVCSVLLLSIGFSLQSGFGLLGTIVLVVIAQTILQSCYLLGVAIHTLLSPSQVSPSQVARSESETEAVDPAGSASASAFARPRKTRRWLRPFAQGPVRSELSSRQR
jgi:lysylphosphatidylglycerol synthetase-like protein (DUF2156 family)